MCPAHLLNHDIFISFFLYLIMKLNKLAKRCRLRKCKMLDNLKDWVKSFIVANRYLDNIMLQQALLGFSRLIVTDLTIKQMKYYK